MKLNRKNMLLVVSCAVFDHDWNILVSSRLNDKSWAGFWEFPGGKIEDGETPEEALVRELFEELSIIVKPISLIPLTFISYPYDDHHMLMPLFACHHFEGVPQGCEGQQIKWLTISDLANYPMLPADKPLVSFLYNYYYRKI
ncbi:MAG: 8-oxo-dGTP diphosphatase MutT [Candidatus Liberibacter europaeus]|uniref:8-oxo-dGTP diphosphatase n=1 Tax=Candidatus Liberibacter europaeus TaxID=744859 RepID=A0A2T4VXV0_9HYPH|nr:8-oxo-dGTP diphosphatase MutT [Candidatus Liberibacter europaeus]PTL86605.1 MAG: 8-oxo-dGTP diphosphatase MutT [Candidatus Liberibacter europaeus]